MKLYHGTSERVARLALKEGLLPRFLSGTETNWADHPSAPDLVYLTTAYAGYFAGAASGDERWGIIEVDTSLLDPHAFLPDEDFLEQASRQQSEPFPGLASDADMETRTRWFRQNLDLFRHLWRPSIENLGNCAYSGEKGIPPRAITRVTVFDPKGCPAISMAAMDPIICIPNYRICQAKYQAVIEWLMRRPVDPLNLAVNLPVGGADPAELESLKAMFREPIENMRKATEGWPGVEVIYASPS